MTGMSWLGPSLTVDATVAGLALLQAKAALLLVVTVVVGGLVRGASAATRHLVWVGGLAGVLLLPLLSLATPVWKVELSLPRALAPSRAPGGGLEAADAGQPFQLRDAGRPDEVGRRSEPPGGVRRHAVNHPPGSAVVALRTPGDAMPVRGGRETRWAARHWREGLLGLWGAGALWVTATLLLGLWRLRTYGRGARPVRHEGIQAMASNLSRQLGLRRPPIVVEGPSHAMPMTWGILRPVVLLPRDADGWAANRTRSVLVHELAHVRRGDVLWQLVAAAACALCWPNPLVWLCARRMRHERELACDDAVLAAGSRPSEYATLLLEIARALPLGGVRLAPSVAMARSRSLGDRLRSLLDESKPRGLPRGRMLLAGFLAATALVLTMAAATPAAAVAASSPTPALVAADGAATGQGDHASTATRAQHDVARICPDEPNSVSHSSDGDHETIRVEAGDCRVDVRIRGELHWDAEFTGLAGIGPGGMLRIDFRDGGTRRYLEARPEGNGLRYDWRVNGEARSFEAEGRAWLSEVLLWLFRNAGLAADERARHLLRTGGPTAVLEETDRISSDYGAALYLEGMLRSTELNAAQASRVVDRASRFESDHFTAEVLAAVAASSPLDSGLARQFARAAMGMDSDHYRAQVLGAAFSSGRLPPGSAAEILAVAADMDSDHYRAEVLAQVADHFTLDGDLRRSYIEALATMESDHYAGTTLGNLLDRGRISPQEVAVVLEVARQMDSDHYRAEVLRQIPPEHLTDATLQGDFVAAAASMDSDHYKADVLQRVAANEDLTPEVVATVLVAARSIASDHYRTEVLVAVAERHPLEGPLRDAYMTATEGIASDHYLGRALRALRGQGR